jgi:cullin-4
LLLFNNNNELSLTDIKTATNIESDELKRVMASLSCLKPVMVLKKTGNPNTISAGDVFIYNADFTSKSRNVKINAIQAQETVGFFCRELYRFRASCDDANWLK